MYYITTPLPYINATPHLGHLLEQLTTDCIARYHRRKEHEGVKLQAGLDQHGLKILQKAQELKQDPANFATEMSKVYRDIWSRYEISYDEFVETHSPKHELVSQIIFRKLLKGGHIYKKAYTGLYCVGCEDFYVASQLTEDGNCPVHLSKPTEMAEENYFFRLSSFTDTVKDYLNTADIRPENVSLEWTNFAAEGLSDISISREKSRMPWGVDIILTDEPEPTQVMYVWFEAVLNYLTALADDDMVEVYADFAGEKIVVEEQMLEDIRDQLPIDCMYHSKEIAKFHLVIFVAMLAALEMPLPVTALVHGMINDAKGHKFSKSLGNGILPEQMETRFGIDGTRFLMFHEVNTFGDTNFDWQKLTDTYNALLANNLGNVIMRVTTLLEKHFPDFSLESFVIADELLDVNLAKVYDNLENFDTQRAIQELFIQTSKINVFLETTKPWSLAKDMEANSAQLEQILGQSTATLLEIGKCLSIFMPATGDAIVGIFSTEKIVKAPVLFQKIVE